MAGAGMAARGRFRRGMVIRPTAPRSVALGHCQRTPAKNATVRIALVISPDKLIKLMTSYPMGTGRRVKR